MTDQLYQLGPAPVSDFFSGFLLIPRKIIEQRYFNQFPCLQRIFQLFYEVLMNSALSHLKDGLERMGQ